MDNADRKQYIGMTSCEFKTRYRNYTKIFRDKKYANEIELSKHVWELKKTCRNYEIKWSILKSFPAQKEGTKRCILCLEEKLQIPKTNKANLLNKRSEIISKCRHVNTTTYGMHSANGSLYVECVRAWKYLKMIDE